MALTCDANAAQSKAGRQGGGDWGPGSYPGLLLTLGSGSSANDPGGWAAPCPRERARPQGPCSPGARLHVAVFSREARAPRVLWTELLWQRLL